MKSHKLAQLLLKLPDLPVATHALGYVYASAADADSHGPLKIGLLYHYEGNHILIGDISRRNINPPNWYVEKMLHGKAPQEWDEF